MATISWVHLSDLHFRAEAQQAWDADIVLQGLLEDVKARIRTEALAPDLILVSGDIAFSGAPAEYELAGAFFDDLLEATDLPKERLFLVPGNHDVDRGRIGILAKAAAPTLSNRDKVNELLSDSKERQAFFERFDGYAAFLDGQFAGHLASDEANCFYVHHLPLAGLPVAILGLNSAWLARGGEEDRHKLALGERQVRTALDMARNAELKIALLHHPFDWLHGFDHRDCGSVLMRECDFVLHGHLHETDLTLQQTPDGGAWIFAAGAAFETRQSYNSYNLVRLDLARGEGTVFLRAWSTRSSFWAKDVLTYRNVSDGQFQFSLSLERASPPAVAIPKPAEVPHCR